jgi:hypothetical protein
LVRETKTYTAPALKKLLGVKEAVIATATLATSLESATLETRLGVIWSEGDVVVLVEERRWLRKNFWNGIYGGKNIDLPPVPM